MKNIELTQGKRAIVDDEDHEYLSQWKWHAHRRSGIWYAGRMDYSGDKQRTVSMHRVIIGAKRNEHVDHKNGDSLDNRKENLRIVTRSQNQMNRRVAQVNNRSGYRGVSWNKECSKWVAQIQANGKKIYLGLHNTAIDAAKTYNRAAKEYFGDFARLNRIPDNEQQ